MLNFPPCEVDERVANGDAEIAGSFGTKLVDDATGGVGISPKKWARPFDPFRGAGLKCRLSTQSEHSRVGLRGDGAAINLGRYTNQCA